MEEIRNQRDNVYLSLVCRNLRVINHFIHNCSSKHTILFAEINSY